MNKAALLVMVAALGLVSGCGKGSGPSAASAAGNNDDKTIKFIMSDAGFNAEIVPLLKKEVAKQGFTLDWVVINDIIQPNKLVDDGSADANSFQHEPYFDQFVADHDLKNITRGFYTVYTPSGLYSKKYKSLDQVPDGATFGIPVDPANNGRALFMLRDKGLLKLKYGVTVTHASLQDITNNPHNYKSLEVDQLMLQRTLDDVDVGFLFSGTARKIGLDPKKDALAFEDEKSSPYKGIVAIRKGLAGTPKIKALQNAYASDAVKAYYKKRYGDTILFLDGLNK
jgi:D-methionine transport system substrate-binding protein